MKKFLSNLIKFWERKCTQECVGVLFISCAIIDLLKHQWIMFGLDAVIVFCAFRLIQLAKKEEDGNRK